MLSVLLQVKISKQLHQMSGASSCTCGTNHHVQLLHQLAEVDCHHGLENANLQVAVAEWPETQGLQAYKLDHGGKHNQAEMKCISCTTKPAAGACCRSSLFNLSFVSIGYEIYMH